MSVGTVEDTDWQHDRGTGGLSECGRGPTGSGVAASGSQALRWHAFHVLRMRCLISASASPRLSAGRASAPPSLAQARSGHRGRPWRPGAAPDRPQQAATRRYDSARSPAQAGKRESWGFRKTRKLLKTRTKTLKTRTNVCSSCVRSEFSEFSERTAFVRWAQKPQRTNAICSFVVTKKVFSFA